MRYGIAFAALLLLVAQGCGGKKHDYAAEAPPPAEVEHEQGVKLVSVDHPENFPLAPATSFEAGSTLNVTGVVSPDVSRTVPVVSLASGRVLAIHAQIGDYVKKGQLLMEVQSADVTGAFGQYLKAVNDERLAHAQDDRAKLLYSKGAIAKSQLEIADAGEGDAQADLKAAGEQLRILGVDKDHPASSVRIYAPVSGVIIAQNVTSAGAAGVTYAGSSTAFTIADLSHVWVVCDVHEPDLPSVHVGQTATIRLNAYPDEVLNGTINEIDAVLDPVLRTAKVRVQVPNPGHIMRLGMFATATFHGKKQQPHTAVPASSILHLHDRDWVYVPAEQKSFRRIEVTGGNMLAGGLQEVSGIAAGQRVVTNALELQNSVEQ